MCGNVEIFFRNHHWGSPVNILGGGQSRATTSLLETKTGTIKLTKKAAVKSSDHIPISQWPHVF